MWPAGENKGVSKPPQRSESNPRLAHCARGGLTAASAAGAGAVAMRESSVVGLVVVIAVATTISAVFALRLAARARAAESLALRDTLTGLPNRALLDDRIEQALQRARRTADAFALMVVDLDGFKEVNDIRGHDAGDQVLQSIARRLESVVRGSDTVARVGGDEFVVLSIGTRSEEEAAALVGRLRHALRRPYRVEGGIVEIDASIGWALFPADGATPEELLCRADVQMFATKRDSGDGSAASRRGSLDAGIVREFESALTRDEVIVHYQPVLDARSGEVQGVEALIRRNHPERGLLAPADFVPHVERTPLIRALTLHVVAEALGNARTWAARGPGLAGRRPPPLAADLVLEEPAHVARLERAPVITVQSHPSLEHHLALSPGGEEAGPADAAAGDRLQLGGRLADASAARKTWASGRSERRVLVEHHRRGSESTRGLARRSDEIRCLVRHRSLPRIAESTLAYPDQGHLPPVDLGGVRPRRDGRQR